MSLRNLVVFRDFRTRLGPWLWATPAALVLTACGSVPVGDGAVTPGERSESVTSAPVSPQKKAYVQKRGGAYYKDDGPGDNPPANLEEIPDAVPRLEPLHRFANRPYAVFGRDYLPATALAPYQEQGVASWYGRKFHGLNTSSGEPYDMYGMTAAHPTLPIPSYVRVTNLANGRSVVVRVNDRGPFHKDRVIDLSFTAAYKLGYADVGSAQVDVRSVFPGDSPPVASLGAGPGTAGRSRPAGPLVLPAPAPGAPVALTAAVVIPEPPQMATLAPLPQPAPRAPAAGNASMAPAKGPFLQLGAFTTQANAEGFRDQVRRELTWLGSQLELLADNGRYRLHAGPYASAEEAQSTAERIAAALKFKPFIVWR